LKKILISDVSLRDGNHSINHQIDGETIKNYCKILNTTGVDICEIGHGNGIGASSLSIGRSKLNYVKSISIAKKSLKKIKLSVHAIPGFAKIEDINKCSDLGVDIFRIGANSPDYNLNFQLIEHCKKIKKEAWCVLMMSHLIYNKKKYLEVIKELKNFGIKQVIFMDTAGYFLPHHIEDIFKTLRGTGINYGIHAHNNFSVGVWNSIIAIQNGANVVDVATRGFGAGSGNTHFEVFAAICKKLSIKGINLNLINIIKLSEYLKIRLKDKFNKNDIFIENNNILSGYFGIVAAFSHQIDRFSKKYNKDMYESYKKVGDRKLVAGQEDLIPDIILGKTKI
jgi:4-hydroxy 2-oxovalerate aldolase